MGEPYEASIREALAALAARRLSAGELLRSLLARIDAVDPEIHAWEALDRAGALAAAGEAEARYQRGEARALEGIPVGIKDIYYTAGLRTAAGFPPYDRLVPDFDAAAVSRLRAAGAIILGKTVTTQFAFSDPPRTRNPWNVARTPGGSSSGSGAAVAARMVPAALGTQTAGSVLRPAAYCGVLGFKPTFGRISRYGIIPLSWSLDHAGIIARTPSDAALVLNVLAGHDPRDPASVAGPTEDFTRSPDKPPAAPALGVVVDFLERAEPEVRSHIEVSADRLRRAGARVREVRLPESLDLVLAVHRVIMQTETAAVHAALHARHAEAYAPGLRAYVEVGQLLPGTAYVQAQRLRLRFRRTAMALLEGLDALLLPAASNTAPDPGTTGDPSFQAPWTMLGFPSVSIPSGLSSAGLPFGSQLVAAPFADGALLAAASWCQDVLGLPPAPPL